MEARRAVEGDGLATGPHASHFMGVLPGRALTHLSPGLSAQVSSSHTPAPMIVVVRWLRESEMQGAPRSARPPKSGWSRTGDNPQTGLQGTAFAGG